MPALQALAAVPSFGSELAQSFGGGLSRGISSSINQMLQEKQQRQSGSALAEYLEKPEMASVLGNLPLDIQKQIVRTQVMQKAGKELERQNSLAVGLETINKMRTLIPSAGPTNYIEGLFGGETTKNRAELETLGRSLIPLVAAGVPIRNQKEFEEYRKTITNPNSRQAELEGALNGLQNLFERSLEQSSGGDQPSEKTNKQKFNPENPEHKSRAIKLHKALKDKEKVRKQLQKEFEL